MTDTLQPAPNAKKPRRVGATLGLFHRARPTKACEVDGIRPALADAHVVQRGDRKVLLTTDSYIAAVHPVPDDVPLGAIQHDALRRIERGEYHAIYSDGSVGFGSPTDAIYSARKDLAFKDGWPEKMGFKPEGCKVITIALNPWLLIRLAKAIGAIRSRGVLLEIAVQHDTSIRAIRVTNYDDKPGDPARPEGLLMPIRLPDAEQSA